MTLRRFAFLYLALFILAFLTWTWVDSRSNMNTWTLHPRPDSPPNRCTWTIALRDSALSLQSEIIYARPASPASLFSLPSPGHLSRYPGATISPWFTRPAWFFENHFGDEASCFAVAPSGTAKLVVPLWTLVLGYSLLVFSIYCYRSRRRGKVELGLTSLPPLHRAIAFWLGLFVLSFLLWAWADSRYHRVFWFIPSPRGESVSIGHSNGAILFTKRVVIGARSGFVPRLWDGPQLLRMKVPRNWEANWCVLPAWESIRVEHGEASRRPHISYYGFPTRDTHLTIPHWLILTLYLPGWLLFSAWRARKIARRQHLLPTPPQAHPSFEN